MLTQADYNLLVSKPGVFDRLPEFRSLRQQPVQPVRAGCRGWVRRRAEQNLFSMFMAIVAQLNDEARARLKQELGVEALMLYAYNRTTGRYEMKTI